MNAGADGARGRHLTVVGNDVAFVCGDRVHVVPASGKGPSTTIEKASASLAPRGPSLQRGSRQRSLHAPLMVVHMNERRRQRHANGTLSCGAVALAASLSTRCLAIKHEASLYVCAPAADRYVSARPCIGKWRRLYLISASTCGRGARASLAQNIPSDPRVSQ